MSTMTVEVKEWREKGLQVVKLHKQIRNLELLNLTTQEENRQLKAQNKELEKEIEKARTLGSIGYFKSFTKLPTKDVIIETVLKHYNVNLIDIQDDSREKEIVRVRMLLSYLLREHTVISYSEIAEIMNRNHASCIHHVKTIKNQFHLFKEELTLLNKLIHERTQEINPQ